MAQPAEKATIKFVKQYTKIWLHANGRKKGAEVIQPPLNEKGLAELEKYRKAQNDAALLEFPVHVGFPFPEGGIKQYIPEPVMKAWEAAWTSEVLPRAPKMVLDIDGDFVGNGRIRINRIMTPKAYEVYCKPFPATQKKEGPKTQEEGAFTEM